MFLLLLSNVRCVHFRYPCFTILLQILIQTRTLRVGFTYLFDEQDVHGAYHATSTNKWTESLPSPAHLPGNTREPSVFASILRIAVVEDIGAQTAQVCHAADKKQHDDQHGGEVEQRTHISGDN